MLGVMVYLWSDVRSERAAAVHARDQADHERELSQGYLKNALGTMDRIVARVGDERFARVPAMQEERNAILAEAVAFYESMLRLDTTDPDVRRDTAETYSRVATLGLLAGRTDQSAKAARSAIDLFESLVREFPTRPEYRDELAKTYLFLAHSQVLNAEFADGLKSYQKGADLAEELAAQYPAESKYKATAAECRRSLGYFFTVSDPTQGESNFRAAVRLSEELFQADPNRAENKALLASVLGSYAQYLVAGNRLAEAEPLIDRGMALTAVPRDKLPWTGQARFHHDQAEIALRNASAVVHLAAGRRDKARALLKEAVDRYESLIANQPQSFPYRLQAINTYAAYARVLEGDKNYTEAVKASGRTLGLYDEILRDFPVFRDPKTVWFRAQRAGALIPHAALLARVGKTAEAERLAAEAEKSGFLAGSSAYNLACLFALLSSAADGAAKDARAAKAMSWLKRAAASGYPANASQVEHIREKDEDLAPIRSRPEFQAWVKTLKPAKK